MNSKYYNKAFQAKAFQWWHSLSINQMKTFERLYGISRFCRMAIASEIAEIYDHEGAGSCMFTMRDSEW